MINARSTMNVVLAFSRFGIFFRNILYLIVQKLVHMNTLNNISIISWVVVERSCVHLIWSKFFTECTWYLISENDRVPVLAMLLKFVLARTRSLKIRVSTSKNQPSFDQCAPIDHWDNSCSWLSEMPLKWISAKLFTPIL